MSSSRLADAPEDSPEESSDQLFRAWLSPRSELTAKLLRPLIHGLNNQLGLCLFQLDADERRDQSDPQYSEQVHQAFQRLVRTVQPWHELLEGHPCLDEIVSPWKWLSRMSKEWSQDAVERGIGWSQQGIETISSMCRLNVGCRSTWDDRWEDWIAWRFDTLAKWAEPISSRLILETHQRRISLGWREEPSSAISQAITDDHFPENRSLFALSKMVQDLGGNVKLIHREPDVLEIIWQLPLEDEPSSDEIDK